MKTSPVVLASLVGLALSSAAVAGELAPLQAGTFDIGNHVASIYYTDRGGFYEVVTTIAPDADLKGAPMRFVGSLAAGEKQVISVGSFGTTAAPRALELVHGGDRLIATVVGIQAAAR